MSFAREARIEVINSLCQNECCKLAELSAIVHSSGELNINGGQISVVIKTDMQQIYGIVNDTLKRLYGDFAEITLDEDLNINKSVRYIITIPPSCSKEVLFDCGIARINPQGNFELIKGIDEHIIESPCCALSYIKGVFITSSTAGIKIFEGGADESRKFSGYHLEFIFREEEFADDFSALLFSQGITSKKSKRKNLFVLYIKEAEQLSDLLAMVGAFKSVLKLQNEITVRQVRNNINRQNNCFSANVEKTATAAMKQIAAIEKIKRIKGLGGLPDSLIRLCELRLAHPEESIEGLAKLMGGVTKSGVNHQLRKLIKMAEDL